MQGAGIGQLSSARSDIPVFAFLLHMLICTMQRPGTVAGGAGDADKLAYCDRVSTCVGALSHVLSQTQIDPLGFLKEQKLTHSVSQHSAQAGQGPGLTRATCSTGRRQTAAQQAAHKSALKLAVCVM